MASHHQTHRIVPITPTTAERRMGETPGWFQDEEMRRYNEERAVEAAGQAFAPPRGLDGPPRNIVISRGDRLTRRFGIAVAVFALVYIGGQMLVAVVS